MRFHDMPEVGTVIVRQYVVRRLLIRGGIGPVPPPRNLTINLIRCVCNLRGWWEYKTGRYHDEMLRRIMGI